MVDSVLMCFEHREMIEQMSAAIVGLELERDRYRRALEATSLMVLSLQRQWAAMDGTLSECVSRVTGLTPFGDDVG